MRGAFLLIAGAMVVLPPAALEAGVAVGGTDELVIQLPASAFVEDYTNAGYRLAVEDGVARVSVSLEPLESADLFSLPSSTSRPGRVAVLSRSLVADARSRYEAVSRILAWMSRSVRYELDRDESQAPIQVLERRSGYCTGIASLAVALLEAVEIPAREVAGYLGSADGDRSAGYHRWIEVFYEDTGWVFSDPLSFHHYVPAHYVRLASESLLPSPHLDRGVVLGRDDHRQVVDLYPVAPPGVSARRNHDRQFAGALRVSVAGRPPGLAVLEGEGLRQVRALINGESTFVGLEPGTYTVTVVVDGRPPVARQVVLRDRIRGALFVPAAS